MSKKDEFKWLVPIMDLQEQNGLTEKSINISGLRQRNKADAVVAAQYLYNELKDHAELYPGYQDMINDLEPFEYSYKGKVVGALFELIETHEGSCTVGQLKEVLKSWDLDDEVYEPLEKLFGVHIPIEQDTGSETEIHKSGIAS